MLKVLIIGNFIEGNGGISGVIGNHYNKIKDDGHIVELFNTKKHTIIRIALIIPLILALRKFNIIHVHGSSNFGFFPVVLAIIAAKFIYTKRTVVTYHGGGADDFLQKQNRFIRFILSKADCVTVMSGFLQEIFKKYQIKTIILPNLIDVTIQENSFTSFDYPRLVSIRALKTIYNIDDILRSFPFIKRNHPNSQLKIIGNGNEFERLSKLSAELQLDDVEFLGSITNDQIPDELSKSNIMISVPSFDNQPMSVLEAFASGIPVISSNVGGIPYMIEDEINGFLVDVNQPEKIAEKVDWIMSNPEKTKIIIANAKKKLQYYQWFNIRKQLFNIYEGKNIES